MKTCCDPSEELSPKTVLTRAHNMFSLRNKNDYPELQIRSPEDDKEIIFLIS